MLCRCMVGSRLFLVFKARRRCSTSLVADPSGSVELSVAGFSSVKVAPRIEFGFAGLLGCLAVAALVLPYSGSPYGHGDGGAFAFLIGAALVPVASSLAIAAFALHRGAKPGWVYQCLPAGVLLGIAGFFAWAK